jgi:hypothetical protein
MRVAPMSEVSRPMVAPAPRAGRGRRRAAPDAAAARPRHWAGARRDSLGDVLRTSPIALVPEAEGTVR